MERASGVAGNGTRLRTLQELLYEQVKAEPQRTALFLADGTEVSFERLWQEAGSVRAFLEKNGVRPGERVVLLGISSHPYTAALWGILSLGAVAVPLNYRLPADDLSWMIEDCGARAVFADRRYLQQIPGALETLRASMVPVAVLDGDFPEAVSWEEVTATKTAETHAVPVPVDLGQTIFVLYTSGTTARPKGVEETHRGYALTAAGPIPMPPKAIRFLHVLPLYHLAGMASLAVNLARGSQIVLLEKFGCEQFLSGIERFKANATFLVPTMMCDLIEFPRRGEFDPSAMKLISYGAAPTPVPVLVSMIEHFSRTFFIQVYSQTEGTTRVTMLGPEDHRLSKDPAQREKQIARLSSIGKVMDNVRIRVCDPEGREVPPGEVGELWYQSEGKMSGYLNREEDTRSTLFDGWIRSGDMVRVDGDGYVYIVGRSKDFLIRGGENIAPREIEEALESHPDVAEAAVVGKPDPRWGEVVVAFARCPGRKPAEEELIAHCKGKLAGFKIPERVWVREYLPRNSVGKILKRVLADEAKGL